MVAEKGKQILMNRNVDGLFALLSVEAKDVRCYSIHHAEGSKEPTFKLRAVHTDPAVKCFDWCPSPSNPLKLSVGMTNGKICVVNLAGIDANNDAMPASREVRMLNPRCPRSCNSVAWNPQREELIAAGMDKARNEHCVVVYDITRSHVENVANSSHFSSSSLGFGGGGMGGGGGMATGISTAGGAGGGSGGSGMRGRGVVDTGTIPYWSKDGDQCVAMAWIPNSAHVLACGFGAKYLKIHDLRVAYAAHNAQSRVTTAHSHGVYGVKIDPHDDSKIATYSDDGLVKVWDMKSLIEPVAVINTSCRSISAIEWCPSRKGLITSISRDHQTVCLWYLQQFYLGDGAGGATAATAATAAATTTSTSSSSSSFRIGGGVGSGGAGLSAAQAVAASYPSSSTTPDTKATPWRFLRTESGIAAATWQSGIEGGLLCASPLPVSTFEVLMVPPPAPLAWSVRGELATARFSCVRSGQVALDTNDIGLKMRNRAESGYSLDPVKNLKCVECLKDKQLQRLWGHVVNLQNVAVNQRQQQQMNNNNSNNGGAGGGVGMNGYNNSNSSNQINNNNSNHNNNHDGDNDPSLSIHGVQNLISPIVVKSSVITRNLIVAPPPLGAMSSATASSSAPPPPPPPPIFGNAGGGGVASGGSGGGGGAGNGAPPPPPPPPPPYLNASSASSSNLTSLLTPNPPQTPIPNNAPPSSSSSVAASSSSTPPLFPPPQFVTYSSHFRSIAAQMSNFPLEREEREGVVHQLLLLGAGGGGGGEKLGAGFIDGMNNNSNNNNNNNNSLNGSTSGLITPGRGGAGGGGVMMGGEVCFFERAVFLLLLGLDLQRAINVLYIAAANAKNEAESARFSFIALALAGHSQTDSWRYTYNSLNHGGGLGSGYLGGSGVGAAYIRASFALLAKDMGGVLGEREIPLSDRFGYAITFLSDDQLVKWCDCLVSDCVLAGDVDGILVTGLEAKGIDLLAEYVHRTGDVQTAALLFSRQNATAKIPDPRVEMWLQAYRDLLDRWLMWSLRARLDIQLGKQAARKPPTQVLPRCNYCQEPFTLSHTPRQPARRNHVLRSTVMSDAARKARIEACPQCKRSLPRCALCHKHLGSTNGPEEALEGGEEQGLSDAQESRAAFESWFAWCQKCRHGGHALHVAEWFETHDICPVAECNCCCSLRV